jgi:hypothetical protein
MQVERCAPYEPRALPGLNGGELYTQTPILSNWKRQGQS